MKDLAPLQAFVAIAREGNLTRAAAKLNLTQPAVSMQIKQLQSSLKLSLFARTPQGLALTADGEALLPLAEQALAAVNTVWQQAEARQARLQGRLAIGTAVLDPAFTQVSMMYRLLKDRHPGIEAELRHGVNGWVADNVRNGSLAAGFYIGKPVQAPGGAAFAWLSLVPFSYHVVAPPAWAGRVAGKRWPELARLPWIWTPEGSVHNQLLSPIFAAEGVAPDIVAVVDREASMLELLRAGAGLCLVRDAIALYEAKAHGLVVLQEAAITTCLSFIALASRREEPGVAALFDIVQTLFE